MAGNKAPKKKRTQRPALVNPIMFGISDEHTRMLKLVPHAELTKLQSGVAGEESWHTITCRLNLGMVLARRNQFGVDLTIPIGHALNAMVAIQERHTTKGKWGVTGDELRHVGHGLVLTDEMQDATTRREHRDCLRIVLAEGAQ